MNKPSSIALANNILRNKLTVKVNQFISLHEVLDLDFVINRMENENSKVA